MFNIEKVIHIGANSHVALWVLFMKTQIHINNREQSYANAYHHEAVPRPQWLPTSWTVRQQNVLTVHRQKWTRRLAHGTAADVFHEAFGSDRHHRNRLLRSEPEAGRRTAGVPADVVDRTEHVRSRTELPHAGPGCS